MSTGNFDFDVNTALYYIQSVFSQNNLPCEYLSSKYVESFSKYMAKFITENRLANASANVEESSVKSYVLSKPDSFEVIASDDENFVFKPIKELTLAKKGSEQIFAPEHFVKRFFTSDKAVDMTASLYVLSITDTKKQEECKEDFEKRINEHRITRSEGYIDIYGLSHLQTVRFRPPAKVVHSDPRSFKDTAQRYYEHNKDCRTRGMDAAANYIAY